jgi:lysophospholipase L1-like esterase
VHTSEDGARFNAFMAVSGLKGLREQPLIRTLSLEGRLVPTATPDNVYVPPQPPPRGADRAAFAEWLNLPEPADPALPTIWLIGDSTVRNGKGNGYDGQFGWGDPLENYFYPTKANLVNRAIGGTGARTYRRPWETIVPRLKPKDVVILQFGHNDNGPRGALPGTGEETEQRPDPAGAAETVHTFGWYLRQYVADARVKGATIILCSPVPRNIWKDGRIVRPENSHAAWARAVATSENVPFIDLSTLLADRYDQLGQEKTTALFADRAVHTNWNGAVLTAGVVAEALRTLPSHPVGMYLRPSM